jgi:peroxiredoxin-like protein
MSKNHDYPVSVSWNGGRGGSGSVATVDGHVRCNLAVPEEFQGPGGAANPEQLLTCAIASCYAITFGIICENRKLPVTDIQCQVTGHVDASGPLPKYTSIAIKPTISVAGADEAQMDVIRDMAHKADLYCIVTNTLRDKVEIRVEPTFVEV